MVKVPSATLTTTMLLKYKGDIRVFIETGSHKGGGIYTAQEAGFDEIYSCETDPEYWATTFKAVEEDVPNCYLSNMRSETFLDNLAEIIDEPCFFWLDAHMDGEKYSPLLLELQVLKRFNNKSVVAIDDRRIFSTWGLSDEFVTRLLKIMNPDYTITFEDSPVAKQDIVVAHL